MKSSYLCFEVMVGPDGMMCYLGPATLVSEEGAIERVHQRNMRKVKNLISDYTEVLFSGIYPIDDELTRYMTKYCEDHELDHASEEAHKEARAYIHRHRERLADAREFLERCSYDEYGEPRVRESTVADLQRYMDGDIVFPLREGSTPFPVTEDGKLDSRCYDVHAVTKDFYLYGREFYLVQCVLP
jgi:hypothetical protein